MALSTTTYALSKKYTDKSIEGLGAIKGAPCTIKSTTETSEGTEVVFEWTGTDGTTETKTITIKNGVSITDIEISSNNHLICTMSDGSTIDAGEVPNVKGDTGFSPTIEENPNNTDEIYKLDITNESGTFTTPNLKGTSGGLDPDRYYDKTQVDALIEPLNEAKHTHENKENVLDKLTTNATGDTLLFNGQEIKGSVEIDDTTTTAEDKVWSAKKINNTIDEVKQSVTEVDNKFADYDTSTEVDNKITNALADYSTTTEIDTKLTDYAKTADVDTKLADYYKKIETYSNTEIDDKFTDFETNLTDDIKAWVNSEENLAIKTALYNNNTLMFYKKPNATVDDIADFSINLPEEQFLDQTKTTFINNFVWSEELYPNSTNPNLDNQPVLVLGVKGDTNVVYSFVSMNELVKIYKASTTVSTVTLTIDDATNTISAEVNISADEGNLLKIGTDGGLYAKVTVDNALSDTSENPVQNKVINAALNSKANTSDLSEHAGNEEIHVTADEKAAWNNKAELSDIPTSLPANGGNSDTVDGLHASDFYQYANGLRKSITHDAAIDIFSNITPNHIAWNSFTDVETNVSQAALENAPETTSPSRYHVWTYGESMKRGHQIAVSIFSRKVYIRYLKDSTWSDWYNIADGGNADTVDGLHASDIQIDSVSNTAGIVTLDGLQGGVPFSSITVSGKNLIDLSRRASSSLVQADGDSSALTISYSTGSEAKWAAASYTVFVKKNTRYYLTCTAETANGFAGLSVLQSDLSSFSPSVYKWGGNEFSLSFNSGGNEFVIIKPYANASNTGLTEASVTYHNIMLSEDENAEYVPEIIGQEITLTASGKNLLKYPYVKTTSTINGITFTDNGDGSITMNGTAAATTWCSNVQQLRLQKGKQYCFSTGTPATTGASPTDNGGYTMYLSFTENAGDSVAKRYEFPNVGSENIVFTANYNYANLSIRVENGAQLNNVTFKPQLEIGGAATEYEPYSGSTVTITPDSNPYTVPNDIRQQEGINNVSASAGKISVIGVKKSPVINRAWEELDNKANLSDIPTSLPADGGNADTVNGLHANEIASNPNLLVNPDFKINQRGQMEYNGNKKYTVDNWLLNNSYGTLTIMDDYIRITVPDTNTLTEGIFQRLRNRVNLFAGKTVTLSAMIRSNSPKTMARIWTSSSSYILLSSGTGEWEIVTKTIQIPESITALSAELVIPAGEYEGVYLDARWMKLEYGSVATIFIPPNPAEELLKVQSINDDGASNLISNYTLPTIMNSQMVSNPNLLTNSYFIDPIFAEGVTDTVFKVDAPNASTSNFDFLGWVIGGTGVGTMTFAEDGLLIENTGTSGYVEIVQNIEPISIERGRPYTLSVNIDDKVYTHNFVGGTSNSKAISETVTVYYVIDSTYAHDVIYIRVPNGGTSAKFKWAKLEAGSVATPFVPPLYIDNWLRTKVYQRRWVRRDFNLGINPNILINSNFKINQRGKSSYSGTLHGLTLDRWHTNREYCVVTPMDDYVHLEIPGANLTGTNEGIFQLIENPERYGGKTLTVSAKLRSNCGRAVARIYYETESIKGAHYISQYDILKAEEWQVLTVTGVIPEGVTKLSVEIMVLNGDGTDAYVDAEWIKLEEGGTPTPYTIPDPATELAKCQRYYQIRSAGDIPAVDLRPVMRITPTVTQLSDGNYAYSAEL